MALKRVWKPLDVDGLRLYKVLASFYGADQMRTEVVTYIIAATSPAAAREIAEKCYRDCRPQPSFRAEPLNVNQPVDWWESIVLVRRPDMEDVRHLTEHWSRHLKAEQEFPELNHRLFEPEMVTDWNRQNNWMSPQSEKRIKREIETEMKRTA